jgi:hypothetical protein
LLAILGAGAPVLIPSLILPFRPFQAAAEADAQADAPHGAAARENPSCGVH